MDGMAIKISKNAGRIVQIVSISCPSRSVLLYDFMLYEATITYRVRIVTSVRMIIEWS